MSDNRYVLSLRMDAATEVARSGGKGASLARLLQAGFPVPDGCVIGPQALADLVQAHHVASSTAAETMLALLPRAELPAGLQEEWQQHLSVLGPAPHGWAVRSSAITEDSATASFAGVYESVLALPLEEVHHGLRTCWSSWWSARAVAYRQQAGLADLAPAMAVVIQPMLGARSAGVAFTVDPLHADQMVVQATPGLGALVVSGVVEPEHYTLSRVSPARLLSTRLPHQESAASLTPEVVEALGALLLRLEEFAGSPQDVEWVWDGEQLWIVQSRPITTLGTTAATAQDVWGNGNLKDVIPGLLSPLTWSLVRSRLEAAMRAQYAQLAYIMPPERPLVRRFWGRAYLNIALLQQAGSHLFGVTPEEMAASLGGEVLPEAAPLPPPSLRQQLNFLRTLWRFRQLMKRSQRAAPHKFAAMRQAWERDIKRIAQLDRPGLLALSAHYETTVQDDLLLHMNLTWGMSGFFTQLQKFLAYTLPQEGASLAAELVTGLGDVSSAEHSFHLWELSRLARGTPQVMAFLLRKDWEAWPQALAGTPFLQAWQAFLDTFGHRALYEIELANPRWREQPDYLFAIITAYTNLPQAPVTATQQAQRRQAAQQRAERLLKPWYRPWLRLFAKNAQEFSRLRENSKSHLVLQLDLTRQFVLRAGELLVADGLLQQRDEAFWLEHPEVLAALQGQMPAATIRQLVQQRQMVRQRDAARQAPELIIGDRPVYREIVTAQGDILTGLPSNPGRVTGIARVLRSPQEGGRLQPGEILIAPSTDPAWTPLFLLAAGLVMETGGYLSHGAIVAREYGIPAVLNVAMATQRIPDGSRVLVDGGQGVVQLLPTPVA